MKALAIAILVLHVPLARADGPIETELFAGGFVSNFYHQFYDDALYTPATRPRLGSVDPQLGVRASYFFREYFAVEADASVIVARVVDELSVAKIYGLRAQVVAQYPGVVTPFVDVGVGLAHLSSASYVLGNDTDFPIHAGVGVRWYVADGLALRVDGRLLRGPSTTASLGATYGEFSVGVSFVTDR